MPKPPPKKPTKPTPPAPEPLLGQRHAAPACGPTLPGAAARLGSLLGGLTLGPTAPTPPHSELLTIARSPGGFVLFDPDATDGDATQIAATHAVAVAGTPADLVAHITAWANAQPREEYPA